ncbi:MAG: L-aspartate oxidase [Deltaproteobacteria bacterium GWA2_45_12]|nr:MAG: L-aspartate oxidase [Deltaproteobacteria bacterium GWA2_45_12]
MKTDILIIGSGIAGLSCALKLAKDFDVTIVTKKEAMEANTRYAQGGIASVMASNDDFQSHISDTLTAGAGLCHENVVHQIVCDGPRLVDELVNWGVSFARRENQKFDLGREGGHSRRRVLHAGDLTGNELESVLLEQVKKSSRIQILEHHIAIDLITSKKLAETPSNECLGVYVLSIKENIIKTIVAKKTILASGGAGKVYLYTSNPDVATGDGMAMAYRAGATLANLEFVQFHPTCLYTPSLGPKNFLISEALRGEGAQLKLKDGSSFMERHHPLKELAPRDIVARAIDFEMKKSGDDFIYLDISHKPSEFIKKRFSNIYTTCLKLGFDLTREPIPVVPAAHYFCGGVLTDLKGQSSLKNLYAIGETACTGLHGANRLASNSLLEAVAMADYASKDILTNTKEKILSDLPPWNPGKAKENKEEILITQNWDEIRRLMWNYVGIVRSNKRLTLAQKRMALLQEEIMDYYWSFKVTSNLIELRNLACMAELIIASALKRKESRGLHYNIDYPDPLESEKKDTIITYTGNS